MMFIILADGDPHSPPTPPSPALTTSPLTSKSTMTGWTAAGYATATFVGVCGLTILGMYVYFGGKFECCCCRKGKDSHHVEVRTPMLIGAVSVVSSCGQRGGGNVVIETMRNEECEGDDYAESGLGETWLSRADEVMRDVEDHHPLLSSGGSGSTKESM
eukprot:PhF_6_TR4749/c0_g1_i1/m.6561